VNAVTAVRSDVQDVPSEDTDTHIRSAFPSEYERQTCE